MALQGAEILLYPTAIGSEPEDASVDSKDHWQMCMRGHAATNLMPVLASNRIGVETDEDSSITFYGSSFIAGPQGNLLAEAGRTEEDLDCYIRFGRTCYATSGMGLFRDRRPSMYRNILSSDGSTTV